MISSKSIIEYERNSAELLRSSDRPAFHLSPPIGWMNDPNGFSWFGGSYHLFYQYYPFNTNWGAVSWGHAVSSDLLRWEQLPPALTPDQIYDEGGCFSGTAIERDGKQMLMYTGFVPGADDPKGRGVQKQCIAFGDGLTYEKYEGNPVITSEDLPKGGDPYEFRDPKIYRAEDGTYRVLLPNRNREHGAQMLRYRSEDGLNWHFDQVIASNRDESGKDLLGWMWECPDWFRLDGHQVLIASAMDVEQGLPAESAGTPLPDGFLAYPGGKTSFCMIGEVTAEGDFRRNGHRPLDQGLDFYAAQTVGSPDGRRILIGWMQDPDTAEHRDIDFPINGQMSLPRELELTAGRLLQKPVRELEKLRTDPVILKEQRLEGARTFEGIRGRCIDMEIHLRPCGERSYREFTLRFAQGKPGGEEVYTRFTYEPEISAVTFDRSHAGAGRTKKTRRQVKVRERNGELTMRLVLDRLSAEVFINDGEQVLSNVIYTDRSAEDITFFIDGVAMVDIAKYRIKEK